MSRYIEPIYDRDENDITDKTSKAYFNISDWERINTNTDVVLAFENFIQGLSIAVVELTAPTITTIPLVTAINQLIENIETIRTNSGLPTLEEIEELKDDWIAGIQHIAPDYENVNQWEKNLEFIYKYLKNAAEYVVYCGVGAVGQPRFYQHRWRQYQWVSDAVTPVRRARCGIAPCGAGLNKQNYFRRYA